MPNSQAVLESALLSLRLPDEDKNNSHVDVAVDELRPAPWLDPEVCRQWNQRHSDTGLVVLSDNKLDKLPLAWLPYSHIANQEGHEKTGNKLLLQCWRSVPFEDREERVRDHREDRKAWR